MKGIGGSTRAKRGLHVWCSVPVLARIWKLCYKAVPYAESTHTSNRGESLILQTVPDYALFRVGVDLFQYGGILHLYVCLMRFIVFQTWKCWVTLRQGQSLRNSTLFFKNAKILIELCSGNAPQFSSHATPVFAFRYNFTRVTSSPNFFRSNRFAEKGVHILNRLWGKLKKPMRTSGYVYTRVSVYSTWRRSVARRVVRWQKATHSNPSLQTLIKQDRF